MGRTRFRGGLEKPRGGDAWALCLQSTPRGRKSKGRRQGGRAAGTLGGGGWGGTRDKGREAGRAGAAEGSLDFVPGNLSERVGP